MNKTKQPASTKEGFLNFAKNEYCTTCLSLACPGSGKTYLLLKCLRAWFDMNMFDEYHVVLPAFKNEMSGSYDWLETEKKVFVYEKYHNKLGEELVTKQRKNKELQKKGKLKEMPRIFFCIDDFTSQGKLFESDAIKSIVTENRHLFIFSWFLGHADKGCIKPAVRQNIFFVFIYKLKDNFLHHAFKEYVNFPIDFDDYKKDFKPFFKEYVIPKQYGALLLGGSRDYSPRVDEWFSED
jgi:hypothetical protein